MQMSDNEEEPEPPPPPAPPATAVPAAAAAAEPEPAGEPAAEEADAAAPAASDSDATAARPPPASAPAPATATATATANPSGGYKGQPPVDQTCKLFVGGLAGETTTAGLQAYFQQFGAIEDAIVMVDRATQKSRGFGFVTFASQESATKAIADGHVIDGKRIDARASISRDRLEPGAKVAPHQQQTAAGRQERRSGSGGGGGGGRGSGGGQQGRVFVGGLRKDTSEAVIRDYFMRYGNVTSLEIMKDNQQISRGFGFVNFDSPAPADEMIRMLKHDIDGKQVECKSAQPRGSDGAPRGGRGGGGGGGAP